MTEVKVEGEFGSSVDDVWKIVGDFVGMVQALGAPVESEGEGIGQLRKISMGPGDPIVERLEELDDDAKRVAYSLLSGPLPVQDYNAAMQLSPAGDGRTKLTWTATFQPVGDEAAARQTMEAVFNGTIAGLQGRLGA